MLELYHYSQPEQEKLLKSMTVLVDTREHKGKNNHILNYFDSKQIPWKRETLQHGDYSFMVPANEELQIPRDLYFTNEICIERKASLDEWAGNLIQDRAGVKKKFSQSPRHTILLIENGSYEDMVEHKYVSNYSPESYWGSFHSIWNEFDVPIIFMPNKIYTPVFIRGYFYYYLRGIIK